MARVGPRLLVVFGSKRGSTREVADAIAARVRGRGVGVEVRRGGQRMSDVGSHEGVVVGGALYEGGCTETRSSSWRERDALQSMPVFVFAMGPRRNESVAYEKARGELDRALAKVP